MAVLTADRRDPLPLITIAARAAVTVTGAIVAAAIVAAVTVAGAIVAGAIEVTDRITITDPATATATDTARHMLRQPVVTMIAGAIGAVIRPAITSITVRPISKPFAWYDSP